MTNQRVPPRVDDRACPVIPQVSPQVVEDIRQPACSTVTEKVSPRFEHTRRESAQIAEKFKVTLGIGWVRVDKPDAVVIKPRADAAKITNIDTLHTTPRPPIVRCRKTNAVLCPLPLISPDATPFHDGPCGTHDQPLIGDELTLRGLPLPCDVGGHAQTDTPLIHGADELRSAHLEHFPCAMG
jgi:hypothetical protein